MDVSEATRIAKEYIAEVFAEEEITHIGLEEVDFDEMKRTWKVTVGFYRPWETGNVFDRALEGLPAHTRRSFKVVIIKDHDGHILSMKDRILAEPA